jgi:hypothetical protein
MADYTVEVSVPNVGPQGQTGPQGETGATGATGATGPANTLSIGAVTTGAAGTTASATITGTAPAQTLSLTIPRGDTGANALTAQDLTPLKALIWRNPDADVVRERINNDNSKTFTNFGNLPDSFLPTLTDLEFYRDFAGEKTLNHSAGPNITFTRASSATFFDADGVLQTATTDAARFDHDPASSNVSRGLLTEEARTNSIRNSELSGVAVGAPGEPPINWFMFVGDWGIREIVGSGTIDGMSFFDVRYSGVGDGVAGVSIRPDVVNATAQQTWSASVYIALVGGSVNNISLANLAIQGRDPNLGLTNDSSSISLSGLNSSLRRFSVSRTLTQQSTTLVSAAIQLFVSSGASVDITLRIAAPQLEQGAFPTSYIPTTNAAATRAADSAIVTPVSGFYNATEGTLYAAFRPRTASGTRTLVAFDNDTEDEQIRLRNVTTNPTLTVTDGGVEQADIDAGTVAANTSYALAGAFKLNDFAASINGAAAVTDTTGTMPTITHLRIGNSKAGNIYNGAIARIAYWPRRLTNSLLQSLTT